MTGSPTAEPDSMPERFDGSVYQCDDAPDSLGDPSLSAADAVRLAKSQVMPQLLVPALPPVTSPGDSSARAAQVPSVPPAVPSSDAIPIVVADARPRVRWWPFAVYLFVWVCASAVGGWLLAQASDPSSLVGADEFPYVLRSGLVLAALGPLVAVLVWIATWLNAERGNRAGLLSDAMVKGALTTFAGVVVWWVMLVAVDRLRLGRFW